MQARGGIAWLLAAAWLLSLICFPLPASAAHPGDTWGSNYRLLALAASSQSPMETQMLGEKPFQAQPATPPGPALIPGLAPSFQIDHDGGATIRLHRNLEMHISFLYNREPSSLDPQHLNDPASTLMTKYGMDYRLLPNLQVGLSGYLYRRTEDGFPFQRALDSRMVGYGSELKYDLGNWSFLLKSQIEPGHNRDQREDLQNWFRVWYAF